MNLYSIVSFCGFATVFGIVPCSHAEEIPACPDRGELISAEQGLCRFRLESGGGDGTDCFRLIIEANPQSVMPLRSFLDELHAFLKQQAEQGVDVCRLREIECLDLSLFQEMNEAFRREGVPTEPVGAPLAIDRLLRTKPRYFQPFQNLMNKHSLAVLHWGEIEMMPAPGPNSWGEGICSPRIRLKHMEIGPYDYHPAAVPVRARRGNILDRNGIVLATSQTRYNVVVDLIRFKEIRHCIHALARFLATTSSEWPYADDQERQQIISSMEGKLKACLGNESDADYQEMATRYRYACAILFAGLASEILSAAPDTLEHDIAQYGIPESNQKKMVLLSHLETPEKIERLKALLIEYGWGDCFSFPGKDVRSYPLGLFAPLVLGYTDFSESGRFGIEKFYDHRLCGRDGNPFLEPKHGEPIRLAMMVHSQQLVSEALSREAAATGAQWGAAILLEASSGHVLAMAGWPEVDLRSRRAACEASTNPVTQALLEPAGTSRLFVAAAAWDSGMLAPDTKVSCLPLNIRGDAPALRDKNPAGDEMTSRDCLTRFSIPGTARMGLRTGWETYNSYLEAFGLKEKCDIDLREKTRPRLADGRDRVHFSRMAIGYSMSLTPMHLAVAYAAAANGGIRVSPSLLQNDVVNEKRKRRVMSPETAAELLKLMEDNVAHGAGASLRVEGVRVGGFTGISRNITPRGTYSETIRTFCCAGVVPVNRPRYVCVVVLSGINSEAKENNNPAASVFTDIVGNLESFGLYSRR